MAHLYTGLEATAVGVCANLNSDDAITSTYRGHGHLLAEGGDPKGMFPELFGKASGYNRCRQRRERYDCQGGTMPRVAFLLKVREGEIEEYKQRHEDVWPEMREALRRNGWHNYSLFIRPDGLLFGYFETPESFEAARAGMAEEEINTKWQESMAPFFEDLGGAHAEESMMQLEEVFHLD